MNRSFSPNGPRCTKRIRQAIHIGGTQIFGTMHLGFKIGRATTRHVLNESVSNDSYRSLIVVSTCRDVSVFPVNNGVFLVPINLRTIKIPIVSTEGPWREPSRSSAAVLVASWLNVDLQRIETTLKTQCHGFDPTLRMVHLYTQEWELKRYIT